MALRAPFPVMLITRPPRPARWRRPTSAVAFAGLFVVLVTLALGRPGGPPSDLTVGSDHAWAMVVERDPILGTDAGSSLSGGYRPLDARRIPDAPVAVLAASVLVAGWALGRRYVAPPRPPVRSWTGGRAGRVRAPPLLAV